jgi:hypothetical protein
MNAPSGLVERRLLDALSDRAFDGGAIRILIDELPPQERFILDTRWVALALDRSMEAWRRLRAYELLVQRCLSYPCSLDAFETRALAPFGVNRGAAVDMTIAQVLPIERNHGEAIYMVPLPINTAIGVAAVYFAVIRGMKDVLRAGVGPRGEDLDASRS